MILPLYVTNGEESVKTFALLDGGANRHVVSKDICRKLNLKGKTMSMRITTLEKTVEGEREVADVLIEGTNGYNLTLNNAIFGEIIASKDDRPPRAEDVDGMEHLANVDFPSFPDGDDGCAMAVRWLRDNRRRTCPDLDRRRKTHWRRRSANGNLDAPRNRADRP